MFRFGLPSFKLLIAGAVAALAFAYHKGVLFDQADTGVRKTRPAAAVAPSRPAKPVPPQRVAVPTRKAAEQERSTASKASAGGMEMPRPKPLLTGAVGKQAKPRPPAGIPAAAGGPVRPKP